MTGRTPLNAWHRAHGAKMVDFAGWDMPVNYEPGILQEHLATRRAGGLFDVCHMGRLRIAGRDRMPFLQRVLSSNAAALEPWKAQYTMLPNEAGGLIDDAYLYRWGADDYVLVVNASNRAKDLAHLREQAARFGDVRIEDVSGATAMIAFQGPESERLLAAALEGGALPAAGHNRLSEAVLGGAPVRVARTGYTGEPVGFELFVPAGAVERVWDGLHAAGRASGVQPVGLGARDTLRLEAAMPLYGHEFGVDPEGREFPAFAFRLARVAVCLDAARGEFIGRAALARQAADGTPRRVVPLAVLDRGIVRQGDGLYAGGRRIGVVTSGTTVPHWVFDGGAITDRTDRRSIALAYVDREFGPGAAVEAEVRGRRLACRLVGRHGRADQPPYFRAVPVA